MRLRIVQNHPIVNGSTVPYHNSQYGPLPPYEYLDRWACKFWEQTGLVEASHAVVATEDGNVVGFFRYHMNGRQIVTSGTWVSKKYRRKGLARKMWLMAVRRHDAREIDVVTATTSGLLFVNHMNKLHAVEKIHHFAV